MYYQIEKMDGYYRIGSPEAVFSYLVTGSEKALLIDTGYGYGDLKAAVRSVTDKPLIIVNTHGHCDHTGGNAQFEETCYIHKEDIGLCKEHCSEEYRRGNIERAMHSVNYETGEEFNALPEDFNMEAYCLGGTGKLEPVSDGACFNLGGATVKVIETTGHTRGGISLLYEEKNILFIGDATGMFVWLFAEESTSLKEYINMLEKMYELDAKAYIGAHNPVPMHREELKLFMRAAKEADYSKGEPFESFLAADCEARVCAIDGMTMKDMFKPGFASVVIRKDPVL